MKLVLNRLLKLTLRIVINLRLILVANKLRLLKIALRLYYIRG